MGNIAFNIEKNVDLNKQINLDIDKDVDVLADAALVVYDIGGKTGIRELEICKDLTDRCAAYIGGTNAREEAL